MWAMQAITALHLHWSTKPIFGDIDRVVDDAFEHCAIRLLERSKERRCDAHSLGATAFLSLVLAASLQDDSSTSSTMVTSSSHTSLVCFDHDRRSTPSFYTSTVHCIHTVDHVGAHATQYRHVRYILTRKRATRTRVASASHTDTLPPFQLIAFQPRPLLDPSSCAA